VLEEIALRAALPSDRPLLAELFAATRQAEVQLFADAEERARFVEMQLDAQQGSWGEGYPGAEQLIVTVDGEDAGRLYIHSGEDVVTIVDVGLLPSHRGRGLGTRLLRLVLGQAAADGMAVQLHVDPTNPARRLYERLGFAPAADAPGDDDQPHLAMIWPLVDLATVDAATFEPLVGDDFATTAPNGSEALLHLDRVVRTKVRQPGRESFSLFFTSNPEAALPQEVRLLTHPALGGLRLLVVPIGPLGDHHEYQAVFT
jgi:ribosomal protein S18 acetylase RimI-like enzyme